MSGNLLQDFSEHWKQADHEGEKRTQRKGAKGAKIRKGLCEALLTPRLCVEISKVWKIEWVQAQPAFHESRRPAVRLRTGAASVESLSMQK